MKRTQHKRCTLCKIEKHRDLFYSSKNKSGRKEDELGFRFVKGECKSCTQKLRSAWIKNHKDSAKNQDLKKLYGVTITFFKELLASQKNMCAICGTLNPGGKGSFHVDHNHETNKVRGLLCHHCNVGLGCFRDNPEILDKASTYIKNS